MKHRKQQAVQHSTGRESHTILPASLPVERPTLAYLNVYYQSILEHLRKEALSQWASASAQAGLAPTERDAKLVGVATHCQKRFLVEQAQVKYLHASALKMAEALLVADHAAPAFPTQPLWLHPLAPVFYRGEQVRGIFLYRPYDLALFDQNPYLNRLKLQERQWCREFVQPFTQRVELALLGEKSVEGGQDVCVITHGLADYMSTWTYEEPCACGKCRYEPLGEDQVRILCQICAEELDYWSRWVKTILLVVSGRLRKPQEEREPDWHEEDLLGDEAVPGSGGSGKKRTRMHGEIVRYDASYFREPSRHEGVSLKATHRLVSPEELADLEEVDLEHVLIRDFTDLDDFTRTLRAAKYYPAGQVPTDPTQLRRVKVTGKKHKQQLISLATWKDREARRAEQRRKQTLVEAQAFKGE